jgi:hypothetical protein
MKVAKPMRVLALSVIVLGWLLGASAAHAIDDLDTRIADGLASIEQQRREIRDYEGWLNQTADLMLFPNPFSFPIMVPPEQLWAGITLKERERALLANRPFNADAVASQMKFCRDLSNIMREQLREELDVMRQRVNLEEARIGALIEQRQRRETESRAATGQTPEALKEAFMREIGELLKKWDKAWCGQGGSGCGATPLIVYDGLRYSLPWKPTQRQIDVLRKRAKCLDGCVMDYMGEKLDKQRSECIRRCDAQYPIPD